MQQNNKIQIDDLTVKYEIVYRKVKYPRLEIKTDFLYIILPEGYDNAYELVKRHESWIYKKIHHIKKSKKDSKHRKLNLERSDEEFRKIVNSLVENISEGVNVKVNQVRFRRMKSRWGSCSSRGNINFNTYLKYLPLILIEYIVFHEIAHLLERGHNKNFWNIISNRFPDYKQKEEELLIYWLKVKELLIFNFFSKALNQTLITIIFGIIIGSNIIDT